MSDAHDAVVVGAGPNGLAAAIVLARAGHSVIVLEANDAIGGGCRSAALTLPGFVHDVCSAIHPMAAISPLFRALRLEQHGLEWACADAPLAHPFDDGRAAVLHRSLEATGDTLGEDGRAWTALMEPLVRHVGDVFDETLRPIRVPRRPLLMARFGLAAVQSASRLARRRFRGPLARGLFAGCAAHSFLPMEAAASASFGLMLALAGHAVDWPVVRGGSQRLADALAACLQSLGGRIDTNRTVHSLADLPAHRVALFDLMPRAFERIAGEALPPAYRRRLRRYRHGPGVFKMDWALRGPIPWTAAACASATTVHVGGTLEEIAESERAAAEGRIAERPFVLVGQQSAADGSRAPAGMHTGWAYCHVPFGATVDMTERIEGQIERFAPGFRDLILARHAMSPAWIESHNANMAGGDIGGGSNDVVQFLLRPLARWNPYTTPNPRLFLCSSATPPGGGVHGMCGYWAAQAALGRLSTGNTAASAFRAG